MWVTKDSETDSTQLLDVVIGSKWSTSGDYNFNGAWNIALD